MLTEGGSGEVCRIERGVGWFEIYGSAYCFFVVVKEKNFELHVAGIMEKSGWSRSWVEFVLLWLESTTVPTAPKGMKHVGNGSCGCHRDIGGWPVVEWGM